VNFFRDPDKAREHAGLTQEALAKKIDLEYRISVAPEERRK